MKPRFTWNVTRAAIVATMAVALLTTTGTAQGKVINAAWHKGTTGVLKVTVPTEVGGTLLQPGSYEVQVRKSGGTSIVEFARWNYNPYAQEGLPVWDREVVATINAVPQEKTSAATRTALMLASPEGNKAVGLQIRGNATEFGF